MLQQAIKCVIVGDGAVGKTSMLVSYTSNTFPSDYIPTVFQDYSTSVLVNNTHVLLCLHDTSGQEDFERLRPMSYGGTDVFLLCYSVDSRSSLENVRMKWFPEIQTYTRNVPIVLAGLKIDLRTETTDTTRRIVTFEEGTRMARDIRASAYVECSAKTRQGLGEVFLEVSKAAIHPRHLHRGTTSTTQGGSRISAAPPVVDTSARESCCGCKPRPRQQQQ